MTNTNEKIRHGQAANLVITKFFSEHSVDKLKDQAVAKKIREDIETMYYLLTMSEQNVFKEEQPKSRSDNLLPL